MSGSAFTKHVLATSLKELMEKKPFSKISISDICDRCAMNRTSFYYHFKDKYDLINWIFDSEFAELSLDDDSEVDFIYKICNFFNKNRCFYVKALQIQGQNSLTDHIKDVLDPFIRKKVRSIIDTPLLSTSSIVESGISKEKYIDLYVTFYASALGSSLMYFLEHDDIKPDEFMTILEACAEHTAIRIYTNQSRIN